MSQIGGQIAAFASNAIPVTVQLSTAISLTSGVQCRIAEGSTFAATRVATNTYSCNIVNPAPVVPKAVSVSLQVVNASTTITLSQNFISVYFILPTAISFAAGENAAIVGSAISVAINITTQAIDSSLLTVGRLLGTVATGTSAPTSVNGFIALYSFSCSVAGSFTGSAQLNVGVGPSVVLNISQNTLPFYCVANSIPATITEYAGIQGTQSPIYIVVSAPVVAYDLANAFYTIRLGLESPSVATRLNSTHFLTTTTLPATSATYEVSLRLHTALSAIRITDTSNAPMFDVWNQHTVLSASPYVFSFVPNQVAQYTSTFSVTPGTILANSRIHCIIQTPSTQFVAIPTTVASNSFSCSASTSFSANTAVVDVWLRLNTSSLDANRRFIRLSSNNATISFLPLPMSIGVSFLTPSQIGNSYSVSFATPASRSNQTFSVNAISVDGTRTLPCNFVSDSFATCTFSNVIPTITPLLLTLSLNVAAFGSAQQFALNSVTFWQNTTILKEDPFIADANAFKSAPLQVLLSSLHDINSAFQVYCNCTRIV